MPAALSASAADFSWALDVPRAFCPHPANSSSSSLRLVVNRHRLALPPGTFDPDQTLLEFLRSGAGGAMPRLTGTKLGCAEGGCGACTVVLGKVHAGPSLLPAEGAAPVSSTPQGPRFTYEYKAVNACLLPLLACHGAHVLTVEGIGTSENPHPIQERIGKLFGSQCGFVCISSASSLSEEVEKGSMLTRACACFVPASGLFTMS